MAPMVDEPLPAQSTFGTSLRLALETRDTERACYSGWVGFCLGLNPPAEIDRCADQINVELKVATIFG